MLCLHILIQGISRTVSIKVLFRGPKPLNTSTGFDNFKTKVKRFKIQINQIIKHISLKNEKKKQSIFIMIHICYFFA